MKRKVCRKIGPIGELIMVEYGNIFNDAASSELIKLVQNGQARVWDETAGAETDLGGALYDGQRLKVE
ncbi:MAG: hypothetical protein ACM3TT_02790 [Syntrophothermus sp.]